jgi:pyruvate-formate lyase-activating enzyme
LSRAKTASCHRASIGDIDPANFGNFHNLPNKQKDRQTMLAGQWPGHGCEYCKNVEINGGHSDRNFQNTIPEVYPPELDSNSSLTSVDPTVLEIFFQNTCNLSCVYCTEKYSSQIEKENFKFGGPAQKIEWHVLKENKYAQLSPLLWDWLELNFHKLQRLQILGGEPLIQQDFTRLVEFINTHPNPNLELNFITNLIVKEQNLINTIASLEKLYNEKKIKTIDILCSVDCWGPEQEYIRYGFSMDIFEKNFNYLLNKPWIRLGILSTVTSLSIPSMPLLAKKYQEWNNVREVVWYPHLVLPVVSHVLSPHTFEYRVWKSYLDEVDQYINADSLNSKNTKDELNGIKKALEWVSGDCKMQQDLLQYLNEIDRRRNLNWRDTFPWLVKEFEHVV